MIDLLKDVIGIGDQISDYDVYLVIISAIGVLWICKSVITGIYQSVLHIFR